MPTTVRCERERKRELKRSSAEQSRAERSGAEEWRADSRGEGDGHWQRQRPVLPSRRVGGVRVGVQMRLGGVRMRECNRTYTHTRLRAAPLTHYTCTYTYTYAYA